VAKWAAKPGLGFSSKQDPAVLCPSVRCRPFRVWVWFLALD